MNGLIILHLRWHRLFKRRRRWLTPAQGWSASDNPGNANKKAYNPERVRRATNPFRVDLFFLADTQGSRWRSNPGLRLANAFGVLTNNTGPAAFGVQTTAPARGSAFKLTGGTAALALDEQMGL